jgi:hypothetical protein
MGQEGDPQPIAATPIAMTPDTPSVSNALVNFRCSREMVARTVPTMRVPKVRWRLTGSFMAMALAIPSLPS